MRQILRPGSLIALWSVWLSGTLFAQSLASLNPEYVRLDVQGVSVVGRLFPLENQSVEGILGIGPGQDDDTGFGGRLFAARTGLGYSSVVLRGFAFNGRLAWVRIGVESSSPAWPGIREQVMAAWEAGGGPAYTCDEKKCFYEWVQEGVLSEYRESVALQLGTQKRVTVPATLKRRYDYLMSPFEAATIGPGACGFPVPGKPFKPLPGSEAIHALVEARNLDLIVNVLRGYNAGARVYALLALERLRRNGLRIPPDVAASMKKVRTLNVPVSTCLGCIVNNGLHAAEIVKRWRDYQP